MLFWVFFPPSVAVFFNHFFIVWEIKYIKPPQCLTRENTPKNQGVTCWVKKSGLQVVQIIDKRKWLDSRQNPNQLMVFLDYLKIGYMDLDFKRFI
jgi:hypothetical protein